MSENLFSIAMSAAKLQAHEVRLKLRLSERRGKVYFYYAERKQVQAHGVRLKRDDCLAIIALSTFNLSVLTTLRVIET